MSEKDFDLRLRRENSEVMKYWPRIGGFQRALNAVFSVTIRETSGEFMPRPRGPYASEGDAVAAAEAAYLGKP